MLTPAVYIVSFKNMFSWINEVWTYIFYQLQWHKKYFIHPEFPFWMNKVFLILSYLLIHVVDTFDRQKNVCHINGVMFYRGGWDTDLLWHSGPQYDQWKHTLLSLDKLGVMAKLMLRDCGFRKEAYNTTDDNNVAGGSMTEGVPIRGYIWRKPNSFELLKLIRTWYQSGTSVISISTKLLESLKTHLSLLYNSRKKMVYKYRCKLHVNKGFRNVRLYCLAVQK